MTDQIDNADEFLAHFGVKGMKWGHVKRAGGAAVATLQRGADKANAHVEKRSEAKLKKFGGSKRAYLSDTGKAAGRSILIAAAATAAETLGRGNPKVKMGATIANEILQTANTVKWATDVTGVADAKRRQKSS